MNDEVKTPQVEEVPSLPQPVQPSTEPSVPVVTPVPTVTPVPFSMVR